MFKLRPKQEEILQYTRGLMGISAVPGSGKTWTLSLLAAQIIASRKLEDDQEVLIVTLVNSAVDNFYQRVSSFIQIRGMLPNMGYRVRTLHGLAHDIVRERPDLLGLDNNFQIIDEREVENIQREIVQAWLNNHPNALDGYLHPDLDDSKREWVYHEQLPTLVKEISLSFVRYAKERQLTPEQLHERLTNLQYPLPLLEMASNLYADYQRALAYRGAVDFDDLIRLALHALEWDNNLLERLRYRWPYILEDEAQDSSLLQEQILRKLVGPHGNWVRVGDPNQAIYETFTTANPKYLQDFIVNPSVIRRELPNSGRSTLSIINLANYLVDWTNSDHPTPQIRDALQSSRKLSQRPDDPQPNPIDDPAGILLITHKYTPAEETRAVAIRSRGGYPTILIQQ